MENDKQNMNGSKYMPFILGVMGAAVIWAAIVTVVVVKFDRRHDRLTSEIKALEDSITARNQTISQLEYDKLVLQEDTALLRKGLNVSVEKVTKNKINFYVK